MLRFRLRTLLILMAVVPLLAGLWLAPNVLPIREDAGLIMLAGALAMVAVGIWLNATEAIAAPVFRFQVRDVLWLAMVLGLLCVLWVDHRNLNAARQRAYDLRLNMRHLRFYYHPDKPPPSPSDVDWTLTEKPIP